MAKTSRNYDDWTMAEPTTVPTPAPTPKKRGMIELNDKVMREAKKSLKEKGIKSEDVKNLPPIEELCCQSLAPPLLRYTLSNALIIEIFISLNLLINA
jgi:hypothetical protein